MLQPIKIDVSTYARLWRSAWWAQHAAMVLSFVVGTTIVAVAAAYLSDQLDELFASYMRDVAGPGDFGDALKDPTKKESLTFTAALYWMARNGLENARVSVMTIITASIILIGAYVFGRGTFRLQLMTVIIGALVVLAAVSGAALVRLVGVGALRPEYDPDGGRVQKLADQVLGAFSFVVLLLSLLLLIVLATLAFRVWRHRLLPDLPLTREMVRIDGVNFTSTRFRMPTISAAGVAIQLGVLIIIGVLLWMFPGWIVIAFVVGVFALLILLAWLIVLPILILYRAVVGEDVLRYGDLVDTASYSMHSSRLLVFAAAFVLARAIWRVGIRFNLARRDRLILKDRPPILLLRSFADDIAGILPTALVQRLFWRRKRLEEMMAAELAHAGPFVAIGNPGERLPQIGAYRFYVAESDWQEVVKSYIARSDLIIMIAGETRWVQWELGVVISSNRMPQLLIVFPRIAHASRIERWQNLKSAFEGTPLAAAANAVDISDAIAIFVRGEQFVVITSRGRHESDYQTAFRVGIYLMELELAQAKRNPVIRNRRT